MALFGSGRHLAAMGRGASPLLSMPGVISGYGGGTFNMDGSQATPVLTAPQEGEAMPVASGQTGSHNAKADAARSIRSALPPMNAATGDAGAAPLGASMRRGFDYDGALQRLAGEKPKQNGWAIAAAILGDALASSSGGQPFAVRSLLAQRQGYQDRLADAQRTLTGWQYRDYARQNEADLNASAPFTIGRDRVQFNPATGKADVLYDGPEDFELYASELGLEPGSDAYFKAVEDYVLRSSGPSAHSRDMALDDYRTANDREMEGLRYDNRRKLEGLRQGNRLATIAARPAGRGGGSGGQGGGDGLPVVSSPAEAARLPKGTRFRTPDGRVKVVP